MGIYIAQIAFLFLSSAIINNAKTIENEKKNSLILGINIFILWVLYALKSENVGIDIAGYKRIFEESAKWGWVSVGDVYFEEGYTLLMKLFSKNGVSFQVFNAFLYALICIPWYCFLNRYSKGPTLSLLIYFCYQFFVFNMSGLRQGVATSICMMAFPLLEDRKIWKQLFFVLLVFIATTIHRSAFIFLIALGATRFRVNWYTLSMFIMIFLGSLLFRGRIIAFVNHFAGGYQVPQGLTLGGSFIMLVGFTAFMLITQYTTANPANYTDDFDIEAASTYMMLCSIALNLILNGSNLLRGAMYSTVFLTIALPNEIAKYDWKSRMILNVMVGLFLLALYYFDVLKPNMLNIVPYEFFWNSIGI